MNKTVVPSIASLERHWYVVDAENKCLGRLASEVAQVLRGKNKPTFTPHLDAGDFVIVINAEKVKVTGNKSSQGISPPFRQARWHEGGNLLCPPRAHS